MNVEVGSIIFYYQDTIYPPKNKYAVFVSTSKKWFFLINSENREHYHCFPILAQNRNFPKHDSFISCSNFFEYDPNKITKIVGELSESEKKAICLHISNARTISKINKEIILDELWST